MHLNSLSKSEQGTFATVPGLVTCQVEGEGDEPVVADEELQLLLPLNKCREVIRHRLPVEEVVHAQQEVPAMQSHELAVSHCSPLKYDRIPPCSLMPRLRSKSD